MYITIDKNAGFCTGVKKTIRQAEEELAQSGSLYCLGQIVHNEQEELRLKALGLIVINHDELRSLRNTKVLIRAHGEPPETYSLAAQNNIRLIEGTCPVVLNLQKKIRDSFENGRAEKTQIVIYGKKNHPEIIGLNGQIKNEAILIESPGDIEKIDFSKPVCLYAQTTKDKRVYNEIVRKIDEKKGKFSKHGNLHFTSTNSICAQVSKRDENLKTFAKSNDVIVFVGGQHSSNGKYLFSVCRHENPNSYYIGSPDSLDARWFVNKEKAGVTGATSTPDWLLQRVASKISTLAKT